MKLKCDKLVSSFAFKLNLRRYASAGSIPVGVYAMQIIVMLILLLWEANFHKQQLVTAQQVNARSVTAGDYAAIISGLGTNGFTREDLAGFLSHYGEIASVAGA